ncbi:MAG: DegQ family serine endoprotease [Isosphaeraceae bacterium]
MASFDPDDFRMDEPPPRPTTPPVRKGFLLVLLGLSLAAALVYGIPIVAERSGYAWEAGRSRAATEALRKLDKLGVVNGAGALFRLATVAVSPAVVNIQTSRYRHEAAMPGMPLGGGGQRFGGKGLELSGVGSGVIIDRVNGYVVTNNHVVEGADQITVRLSQGAEVRAQLVGADSKTDLAVLQIKASLKVEAEWGDSEKLASGDWVLAIGSPYMLDHTVTAGIVSATGRNNLSLPGMDENAYQDFIQTDAAINPGNSGGPLIDLNGKVIGINTAILSSSSFARGNGGGMAQSGGFEGIGLAIPSSMARRVVTSLIKNGKMVRGYLGVVVQPLTEALAKEYKHSDTQGAIVSEVQKGSPAEKAGLQLGDVVIQFDGRAITDPATLRSLAAALEPGSVVPLEYRREGKATTVKVVIGQLSAASVPALTSFGFRVRDVPSDSGSDPHPGVVIDQVAMGSPAARAGLQPNLRVLSVGRNEVHSRAEFEQAIAAFTPEQGLPLLIRLPNGQNAFITVGGTR